MSKLFMLGLVLIMGQVAMAAATEFETSSLVCAQQVYEYKGVSISCVSKASVQKDRAELKLIETQQQIAEIQLAELVAKKALKPVKVPKIMGQK